VAEDEVEGEVERSFSSRLTVCRKVAAGFVQIRIYVLCREKKGGGVCTAVERKCPGAPELDYLILPPHDLHLPQRAKKTRSALFPGGGPRSSSCVGQVLSNSLGTTLRRLNPLTGVCLPRVTVSSVYVSYAHRFFLNVRAPSQPLATSAASPRCDCESRPVWDCRVPLRQYEQGGTGPESGNPRGSSKG
jgi:hypothetical protein